jgi:hypothetical protein
MEHRQLEGSHGNYVIGGEVIDYFGVPGGGYPQPKPLLKGNPALLGLVLSPTQNTPDTKVRHRVPWPSSRISAHAYCNLALDLHAPPGRRGASKVDERRSYAM